MSIKSFTDLVGWQKAHSLVKKVYMLTDMFPKEEKFGLTSQIRRSAISITSNVAEGFGRQGIKDKARFFDIAIGSTYELQSQLFLATDLGYLNKKNFSELANLSVEVAKIVGALRKGALASNF